MLVKLGVDISRLRPKIRKKLTTICYWIEYWTGEEAVCTSTYEGDHRVDSLHYLNLAIDFRCKINCVKIVSSLKGDLGSDYDIVNEVGHIHIEYDPKRH